MESESAPELRIIRKYASEVKEAVASCESVHKFADKLAEKNFISLQLQSDILYHPSSPLEKSGRLFDAVRSQVKLNPSNFAVFIDILEEESPLKSLAAQLKQDYGNSQAIPPVLSRQSSHASTDSSGSMLEFSATSLDSQWAYLIATLTEILSSHENALMKMKTALQQKVRSKPVRKSDGKLRKKFTPLVASPEFKETKTVDALFDYLAPYWNWKEYSLLEFLVNASGCKPALDKLQAFIDSRRQAAPYIVLPTSSAEQNTGDPLQPQTVLVRMTVKRDSLTLEEYDEGTSLLCRVIKIPRYEIALEGIGTGSIAIRWRIASHFAEDLQHTAVTDTLLQELAQQRVVQIIIGPNFHLSVATLNYWEKKQAAEHRDIFKACREGDLDGVWRCLKSGISVDARHQYGMTALMYASAKGHREVAQLLLEHDPDVNAQEKDGWSALMLASAYGHRETAQLLLEHDPDVNALDKDGWSALMLASAYGRRESAQLLLEHDPDINTQSKDGWTALMCASRYGHKEIAQLLLEHDPVVNVQNKDGWTALMCASRNGHKDVAQLLLEYDPDINAQNKNGLTALMYASANGHREIAQLLLEYDVDVNMQDKDGVTALMCACGNGRREIAQLLLEYDPDVNARDKNGLTAVMYASAHGHREIAQLLLVQDPAVNAQDMDGFSALMWASKGGHTEIVLLLLDHLAEINVVNVNGMTALDIASASEHPETYQILALNGAVHGSPIFPEVPQAPPFQPAPLLQPRPSQQLREILYRREDGGEDLTLGLLYRSEPPLRDMIAPPDQQGYDPMAEHRFDEREQY